MEGGSPETRDDAAGAKADSSSRMGSEDIKEELGEGSDEIYKAEVSTAARNEGVKPKRRARKPAVKKIKEEGDAAGPSSLKKRKRNLCHHENETAD